MARLTAVFSAPFVGGSEVFNLEFLRDACAAGAEVTAIVPGEGALAVAIREITDDVVVVPIPAALGELSRFGRPTRRAQARAAAALVAYLWSLRRAITRSAGPVCALGFRAQLGTWLAGAGLRRPRAWVVHELVPAGRFGRVWGRAARSADLVIGFSQAVAKQPLLHGVRTRTFDVRLDLAPFFAAAPPTSPVRRIGLVGDLFPLKNQLGFLAVVDALRAAGVAVDGLLVGRDVSSSNPTAEYTAEVERAVAQREGVELVAATATEMPARLAEIDVLLHLSTVPESFGRVVVEAMAAGRPVVAFRRGAIPELIEDGVDGILVAADDLPAVVAAVRGMVDDAGRAAEIGTAARATAARRWDASLPGETIGAALAAFASAPG